MLFISITAKLHPPEKLAELGTEAGFEVTESRYIQRETVNKKEGLCVPRIFIQGRLIKPGRVGSA